MCAHACEKHMLASFEDERSIKYPESPDSGSPHISND